MMVTCALVVELLEKMSRIQAILLNYRCMKFSVASSIPKIDTIFQFVFQPDDHKKFTFASKYFSAESKKHVENLVKEGDFKGEEGEMIPLFFKENSKRLILVGLGKEKEATLESLRKAAGSLASYIRRYQIKEVGFILPDIAKVKFNEVVEAITLGFRLGGYQFTDFVSEKSKKSFPVETLTFVTSQKSSSVLQAAEEALSEAEGVMLTRNLVNSPPSHMIPSAMAEEAKRIAKESKNITCKVLDEKEIHKLGMGLLEAVGQASKHPPRLIILEYKNKPKNKKPIAIVGKGISFDTGGVNLKPTNGIEDMKMDMAGAASVLGIFKIIAKMQPHLHILGVLTCAENAIGGNAFRPGDILTAYNGMTVEITNTDAEGRLVLGDAISYTAKQYKPEAFIDMATLTGACTVALGDEITGLISDNEGLKKRLKKAAEITNEYMWELPYHMNYARKVKGEIADLKNWTAGVSAGTIMGGAFIRQFTENIPWAHLDIAGSAWAKNASGYKSQGGTGTIVRTIWELLKNY